MNVLEIENAQNFFKKNNFEIIKKQLHKLENSESINLDLIKTLQKIALNTSANEWLDFVGNNEVPSVKLTKAEMENIKGGIILQTILIVIGLYAAFALS